MSAIFPRWRVMIFPGATEIAMELFHSLAWCKEVELFSAGSDVSNHAPFVFARHFVVPLVQEARWIEALAKVVLENEITHIFPAHDDALLALAENAERFGAKVVTSPLRTCKITRSKLETLRVLARVVPTPQIYDVPTAVDRFPVFLKPERGQGSQRTAIARNSAEIKSLLTQDPERIILEYLPGQEFTVDCFSDREKGVLFVSGRQRRRIRAGIAMDSVAVADERFADYAKRISQILELHGAWFFQVKADAHGVLKLMEVAPRIGGTSAASRVRGVNLPLLSLYEAERIPVHISAGGFVAEIDRALVNRYRHNIEYRTIYLDFDDTLIIRGEVNESLVRLLYQALNRGVRLVLLSRHNGDLESQLKKYRLAGLFDKIVHLRNGEPKWESVTEEKAILIDDSFAERAAVHEKRGIPVFDPSMIEVLFDDRR